MPYRQNRAHYTTFIPQIPTDRPHINMSYMLGASVTRKVVVFYPPPPHERMTPRFSERVASWDNFKPGCASISTRIRKLYGIHDRGDHSSKLWRAGPKRHIYRMIFILLIPVYKIYIFIKMFFNGISPFNQSRDGSMGRGGRGWHTPLFFISLMKTLEKHWKKL